MYSRVEPFLRSLEYHFGINPLVSAETIRHSSTYIVLYISRNITRMSYPINQINLVWYIRHVKTFWKQNVLANTGPIESRMTVNRYQALSNTCMYICKFRCMISDVVYQVLDQRSVLEFNSHSRLVMMTGAHSDDYTYILAAELVTKIQPCRLQTSRGIFISSGSNEIWLRLY